MDNIYIEKEIDILKQARELIENSKGHNDDSWRVQGRLQWIDHMIAERRKLLKVK